MFTGAVKERLSTPYGTITLPGGAVSTALKVNNPKTTNIREITNEELVTAFEKTNAISYAHSGMNNNAMIRGMAEAYKRLGKGGRQYNSFDDFMKSKDSKLLKPQVAELIRTRGIDPSKIHIGIIDEPNDAFFKNPQAMGHLSDCFGTGVCMGMQDGHVYVHCCKKYSFPGSDDEEIRLGAIRMGGGYYNDEKNGRAVLSHECVHAVQMLSGFVFSHDTYEKLDHLVAPSINRKYSVNYGSGADHGRMKQFSLKDRYDTPAYDSQYDSIGNSLRVFLPGKSKEAYFQAARRMEAEAWMVGQAPDWLTNRFLQYEAKQGE
jgi:hypothetical protein